VYHQPRYRAYAATVSLFTAAMLLVVVADDLVVLLVGWEVMGLCSYLLIGHLRELPEARDAAVKAFVVTRLGDVGLLFGIFTLGDAVGSFQISRLQEPFVNATMASSTWVTVGTLLVLCGVVGKSAQVPLHVWLPDAMAGPTPVSALIHAATMVAAGVFLVARLSDVFALAPVTLGVLAVVATITMLGAALAALAQDDLKRVLAWSTASQLAIMLGGLAVGGRDAGLLLLLSHAAFKSLLFLGAGVVITAVGSNLLAAMGGLHQRLPTAYITMAIGFAALVGIPPLSGFFAKESVLHAAEEAALHGGGTAPRWAGWLVLVATLVTIAVTAAYATRAFLLVFLGSARARPAETMEDRVAAPRPAAEAPGLMRWPLVALAVPTVLLGFLALLPEATAAAFDASVTGVDGVVAAIDAPIQDPTPVALSPLTTVLSLALVALGVWAAYDRWSREPGADPAAVLGPWRRLLAGGFGVDRLYDDLLVRPTRVLARAAVAGDRDVVEGYVQGSGRAVTLLGAALRLSQRGEVQRYATVVLAAVVVVVVAGVTLP
jgi:NADH-quinone oxidoreductase subunit L